MSQVDGQFLAIDDTFTVANFGLGPDGTKIFAALRDIMNEHGQVLLYYCFTYATLICALIPTHHMHMWRGGSHLVLLMVADLGPMVHARQSTGHPCRANQESGGQVQASQF